MSLGARLSNFHQVFQSVLKGRADGGLCSRASKGFIGLDFDCTITVRHFYKCLAT